MQQELYVVCQEDGSYWIFNSPPRKIDGWWEPSDGGDRLYLGDEFIFSLDEGDAVRIESLGIEYIDYQY